MKKPNLEGVSLDGIPLSDRIEELEPLEPMDNIDPDVNEDFNKNHHIYKTPIHGKTREYQKKGGAVERKRFDVNKANMEQNIVNAIRELDTKKAIISVILGIETHRTLAEIFGIIKQAAKSQNISSELFFTAHALRNPLGLIMKTEFADYVDVFPRGSGSARYRINPVYRDKFTIEEVMKMVKKYVPEKRKRKKKDPELKTNQIIDEPKDTSLEKPEKLASFPIKINGGEVNVSIFGKIQIEFSFK